MKKQMMIALISMLVLLAACTNNNEENTSSDNAEEADTTLSEDNKEEESAGEADEETEAQSEDEEIANFPEYNVLTEEVNMDNFAADIKTDNPNKRVMVLADDNGKKLYKSIYIKKKQRLKIISLDDEGQIFNEVIG